MNKNQLKKLINEPQMGLVYLRSHIAPEALYRETAFKSCSAGLKGLYFILSFDCDTEDDIAVVESVNEKLLQRGITAVYAVPGELILKGRAVYERLRQSGAAFINHGQRTHTIKTPSGKYLSVYDYDKISRHEMFEDIQSGHETLATVLNVCPTGFRTPHFGALQARRDLRSIHGLLSQMGYRYSSSTVPYYGFRYGAAFKAFGLWELPVSGLASEPLRIFDSFLYCDPLTGQFDAQAYYDEGRKILLRYERLQQTGAACGLINLYADPSQIHESEAFFNLMGSFAEISMNTTFEQLIDGLEKR